MDICMDILDVEEIDILDVVESGRSTRFAVGVEGNLAIAWKEADNKNQADPSLRSRMTD